MTRGENEKAELVEAPLLYISQWVLAYLLQRNPTQGSDLTLSGRETIRRDKLFRHLNSPPLWYVSVTLRPSLSSTLTVRPVIFSTSSSSCLSPLHLYLPIKVCHGLRHLPYVTGAHIRENNLWLPWIRDGARFPMIRLWYENSLQYLDRGEASDRCSPACCRQTRVSETSCREHPGGPAGRREEEEEDGEKVRGNGRNMKK